MKGSVNSIESLGLYDGPGIRVVVFLNGCKLRCKYCHNPEMWMMGEDNTTVEELVKKIRRFYPYIKRHGGVTFSGGEPLQQIEFITEVAKILKEDGIHVALDTAGFGNGHYEELLKYIDLVIYDVKHVSEDDYKELTSQKIDKSLDFINDCNELDKELWIRQVIVPGINDSNEYVDAFNEFIKPLDNITNVEFIPYHRLGSEKYSKMKIKYPMGDTLDMDIDKCNELYEYFKKINKK